MKPRRVRHKQQLVKKFGVCEALEGHSERCSWTHYFMKLMKPRRVRHKQQLVKKFGVCEALEGHSEWCSWTHYFMKLNKLQLLDLSNNLWRTLVISSVRRSLIYRHLTKGVMWLRAFCQMTTEVRCSEGLHFMKWSTFDTTHTIVIHLTNLLQFQVWEGPSSIVIWQKELCGLERFVKRRQK